MNSFCCQQNAGEYTKISFRLFVLSIFIHFKLHRIRYIRIRRCSKRNQLQRFAGLFFSVYIDLFEFYFVLLCGQFEQRNLRNRR